MTEKFVSFEGQRLLVLGFGSIAVTLLPLILKHIVIDKDKILVVCDDDVHADQHQALGLAHLNIHLTFENYEAELGNLLSEGDCLLNLSGGISTRDLVAFCLNNGIDYLDTANERWEHGAVHSDSGDFAKQWALLMADGERLPSKATAMVSHGANPGIVSHFAKQAVEMLARQEGLIGEREVRPDEWSSLAQQLEIEAIHISEKDNQSFSISGGRDGFINTWSVEGLIEEGFSAPCFAWGSHEAGIKGADLRRDPGAMVGTLQGAAKDCAIRSWLPTYGEFDCAIIPHEETFSIAELFSEKNETGEIIYQPSVLFAYRPCDEAYNAINRDDIDVASLKSHVSLSEVVSGADELGILILRAGRDDVYWYGSRVTIEMARDLVPRSNATTIQVAAGALGGLIWVLENRKRGLVAAEEACHRRVLDVAEPYLGEILSVNGRWENSPDNWQIGSLLL